VTKTLVEQYVEDPIHMRLFQQERAIYEVTELIESLMQEQGVSRTELAKRLGKTKGWITQLLDGEANKTIRTVADTFAVLGREYHSSSQPIQISRTTSHTDASSVVTPAKGSTTQQFHQEGHRMILKIHANAPVNTQDAPVELQAMVK
jgi:transcriptional regulator with XRE-family HTH domain